MIRTLFITQRFPLGAGETFLRPELEALASNGIEPFVLPLHESGSPDTLSDTRAPFYLLTLQQGLRQLLSTEILNPQLIRRCFESAVPRMPLPQRVLNLKAASLVPATVRLVRAHGIQHIHAYWATEAATLAMLVAREAGIAWSFTAHRYDIIANNLLPSKLATASFSRFISHRGLRRAEERAPLPIRNAHVVHLGVAIPLLDETSLGRWPPPNRLICPAAFVPVKGHGMLLDALHLLREEGFRPEVWLAGSGPLRRDIERQVWKLSLQDQLVFCGQMPHSQLLATYADRKVGLTVLPSRDLGRGLEEGIPVALMEAMSFGVPVVSTKTGGISELVRSGGILVEGSSPGALADAIRTLFSNRERYRACALGARDDVRPSFDVLATSKALSDLIRNSTRRSCDSEQS